MKRWQRHLEQWEPDRIYRAIPTEASLRRLADIEATWDEWAEQVGNSGEESRTYDTPDGVRSYT
jgi:hypothetical protein